MNHGPQVALNEVVLSVSGADEEQMIDQTSLEVDVSRSGCRKVVINGHLEEGQAFPSNKISTGKYGLLTFLPKFLFEQFQRYSNVFFLFIAILQQIPGVSPTGRWNTLVPLVIVLSATALKEIIEDWKRHRADHEINDRLVRVFRNGTFQMMKWTQVVVGDVVKIVSDRFKSISPPGTHYKIDLTTIYSEPNAICYIETSNLDGETNLKIRQGSTQTANLLSASNVGSLESKIDRKMRKLEDVFDLALPIPRLFSVFQLQSWKMGVVLYTGHDSKLMQNSSAAPIKRSRMDRTTNVQVLLLFLLLLVLALISAIIGTRWMDKNKKKLWYLASSDLSTPNFFLEFLTFIVVYNNLIPISLIVTIEFVKFMQAHLINMDLDMYYAPRDTPAMARTSNINEELGQVKFIFSDKTGTITCNEMTLKKCSVAGIVYGNQPSSEETSEFNDSSLLENIREHHPSGSVIREFLSLLAVCHTVVPERKHGSLDDIVYQASSPDEGALVLGAKKLGFSFNVRTHDTVVINALGKEETYEILHVLDFTSARKRMSVIVRSPSGQLKIYCKGADSVIYDRLCPSQLFADDTLHHMEQFATEGLRTLCIAMAEVEPNDYQEWRKLYQKASTSLHNRQEEIEKAADIIEHNLFVIGATAIEDKLQEGVAETISKFHEAGIRVWMLTGDKQETAVNIGYACSLISQGMNLMFCTEKQSVEETKETLTEFSGRLSAIKTEIKEAALVIDGTSLLYALECDTSQLFVHVALSCRTVICCRATPMQKTSVVSLFKNSKELKNYVTLAVGDGANDVGMIQAAHVGVGISGHEGLQASCASDYSIAQFRFLQKLLFVHGVWSYIRLSKVILYSFYKNICLYLVELWFAIQNGFSGHVLFERWTISLYNVIFTLLPPLVLGIVDRPVSIKSLMSYPKLYKVSQSATHYNTKIFWIWILNAVVHSAIAFWLVLLAIPDGDAKSDGVSVGQWFVGVTVYTIIVFIVCFKAGLITEDWTWLSHAAIWGSIVLWLVFLLIYCHLWPYLNIGVDMFAVDWQVYSSGAFWFLLIVVPVIALLIDFTVFVVGKTMWKSSFQHLSEAPMTFSARYRSHREVEGESIELVNFPQPAYSSVYSASSVNIKQRGYAFSQEENGVTSQGELIRQYDTMSEKPRGD